MDAKQKTATRFVLIEFDAQGYHLGASMGLSFNEAIGMVEAARALMRGYVLEKWRVESLGQPEAEAKEVTGE